MKYPPCEEEREALLDEANETCRICDRTQVWKLDNREFPNWELAKEAFDRYEGIMLHPSFTLVIDHDHATGEVRGAICSGCNSKLGWYEKHAQRISRYLAGQDQQSTVD